MMLTNKEIDDMTGQIIHEDVLNKIIELARIGTMVAPESKDLKDWIRNENHEINQSYHSCWHAAQAAILTDENILDLRTIWQKAPDRAIGIQLLWIGLNDRRPYPESIMIFDRPKSEWRPAVFQDVWIWKPRASFPDVFGYGPVANYEKGTLIAAAHAIVERHWTREQFIERGECWVVK